MIFLEKDNNIFDYFSILLFSFLLFPNPFYINGVNNVSNLLWDNSVFIIMSLILVVSLVEISYCCIKEKSLLAIREKNTKLIENREKIQPILNLIYSIAGLVIFNGIIQFILYPFLNKRLGDNSFGVVLTLLSLIAIVSGSFGTAVNNSRMVYTSEKETKNGDYNVILLLFNIIGFVVITIFLICYNQFSLVNVIFVNLLMFVTMFRYYADVEYRKNLNYFSFLIYYLFIGIGYCIGCLIYLLIPIWELAMIIGESLALGFVLIKGGIFKNFFSCSNHKNSIWKLAISLSVGELISNLVLNADRILLYIFMDGTAVTTYYVASLVGKIVALVTIPLIGVIMGYLARYKGQLTKKFIFVYFGADILLGICAFLGCYLISPFLIKILYPETYSSAMNILLYAILGQVIFFCTNLLNVLLLKFYDSKVQFILSVIHLIVFITCSLIGIFSNGLLGFSVAACIGNLFKLALIILVLLFVRNKNLLKHNNMDNNYEE